VPWTEDRPSVTRGRAGALTPERAADVITIYNDPGLHRHLVGDHDWTYEDFRDWLARTLHHELLT